MRQPEEFFADRELSLVYIAKRLKEALKIEDILTEAEIDYFVEPDEYKGGFLFPMKRVGAFIYVTVETLPATRTRLTLHGYAPYQPEER